MTDLQPISPPYRRNIHTPPNVTMLLLVLLTLSHVEATKVIVTFATDLPVSVGYQNSSAPTPSVVPALIPNVTLVADLPYLGEAIFESDMDVDETCDTIMMYQNIETCEPDSTASIGQTTATPNDPDYPQQTYLNTTGVVGLWQQQLFGNQAVRIGVIDSGVDLNSSELVPSLWTNPNEMNNGADNDNDGVPGDVHCASFINAVASGDCSDENGHGSFVSGEIAAVTNNKQLIAGIVQRPTLIPCKYIDASGNGQISDALLCFNWLASKQVQVLSCSWGTTTSNSALQQAVTKLSVSGVFISTSAGNNGVSTDVSPQFPSAYSANLGSVVGVAATDATNGIWSQSNYGNTTVQLAAPGVSIIGLQLGGGLRTDTGTSMVSVALLIL